MCTQVATLHYRGYTTFRVGDAQNGVARVEACVAEIKAWMVEKRLMVSGNKTIYLLPETHQQSISCDIDHNLFFTIDGHHTK